MDNNIVDKDRTCTDKTCTPNLCTDKKGTAEYMDRAITWTLCKPNGHLNN